MKTASLCTLTLAVLLIGAASPVWAADAPTVTLLDELPTVLAVGETYTIEVLITSPVPFNFCQTMLNKYYPGRAIRFGGPDHANRGTTALLQVTITGKNSTGDLGPVLDWPETEDWPCGVAPLSLVAGCRFQGGETFVQQFPFAVAVP